MEATVPTSILGADEARVLAVLESTFGYTSLRPLQDRAIAAALAGRDALIVLPTGGGKSLCYQIPALLRPGLTVVVSPLISLMQDQVEGLRTSGAGAVMLNSAIDADERRAAEHEIASGAAKLVYVAPERLLTEGFLPFLERYGLNGIAIDEAHCISHWGHDFRPEYRMLGELRRRRPDLAIQAFTATATPRVREDIVRQLALSDPELCVGGFDRPNLSYRVLARGELAPQVQAILARHTGEAAIVYCLRRTDTEELSAELARSGVRCAPYHAGLPAEERRRTQRRFLDEDLDVVVATVAFGMGIDRSDVRCVVHASLPKGIEQYSQETGRAGRDGLAAECVLLHSGQDVVSWRRLIELSARSAQAEGVEGALTDLGDAFDRLDEMYRFAVSAICRHKILVEHFGQTWSGSAGCGACDVCLGEVAIHPDSSVIAQKILSCVVRTGQRYGAAHVTDVLRGAQIAKIRQCGHDQLTTFGLLKQHSSRELRSFVDQLVGLGHLRVAEGEYPTLFLSQSGIAVMKAEQGIALAVPAEPHSKERKASATRAALASEGLAMDAADPALFEALRTLRRELARQRGIPPYLVFNDRTLVLFAARKPRTSGEFRAIKGVGDKKAAEFAEPFLAAIAANGG